MTVPIANIQNSRFASVSMDRQRFGTAGGSRAASAEMKRPQRGGTWGRHSSDGLWGDSHPVTAIQLAALAVVPRNGIPGPGLAGLDGRPPGPARPHRHKPPAGGAVPVAGSLQLSATSVGN
jgi:hypothetical protein